MFVECWFSCLASDERRSSFSAQAALSLAGSPLALDIVSGSFVSLCSIAHSLCLFRFLTMTDDDVLL